MKAFILSIVIILGMLLALRSEAHWHVLELKELSFNYKNYAILNEKARNALLYPESPKEGLNVSICTDIFSYFYFDSTLETLTTGAQYRGVGLLLGVGIRLSDALSLGYYHHSQHVLDRDYSAMPKFPVEDALELKIYLYKNREAREGLF